MRILRTIIYVLLAAFIGLAGFLSSFQIGQNKAILCMVIGCLVEGICIASYESRKKAEKEWQDSLPDNWQSQRGDL